jgi:hypothetical protein
VRVAGRALLERRTREGMWKHALFPVQDEQEHEAYKDRLHHEKIDAFIYRWFAFLAGVAYDIAMRMETCMAQKSFPFGLNEMESRHIRKYKLACMMIEEPKSASEMRGM